MKTKDTPNDQALTTTAAPKKRKLSLAGCTTTPHASATRREIAALSFGLCEQVEMLRGLCRTLSIFAYADESLDGLSVKDIGNTALLMGQTLDSVHGGLEEREDLVEQSSVASHIQKGR